jgi:hypothetical protein
MAQRDLVVVLVNRHYGAFKWTGIVTSTGVSSRRAMAVNRRSRGPSTRLSGRPERRDPIRLSCYNGTIHTDMKVYANDYRI